MRGQALSDGRRAEPTTRARWALRHRSLGRCRYARMLSLAHARAPSDVRWRLERRLHVHAAHARCLGRKRRSSRWAAHAQTTAHHPAYRRQSARSISISVSRLYVSDMSGTGGCAPHATGMQTKAPTWIFVVCVSVGVAWGTLFSECRHIRQTTRLLPASWGAPTLLLSAVRTRSADSRSVNRWLRQHTKLSCWRT